MRVVLKGRLSNSSPQVRKLLDQLDGLPSKSRPNCNERAFAGQREETGRSARTVQTQRRLTAEVIAQLAAAYQAGATVPELVNRFQVHRTTVLAHLERQGIPRRANRRKLTDEQVAEAARLYAASWSTARVGEQFNVSAETVRRYLRTAGVRIGERRRGLNSSGVDV